MTSLGAISLPVEPTLDDLMNALGYEFVHRDHLRDALTHRSFANERPKLAPVHNERLAPKKFVTFITRNMSRTNGIDNILKNGNGY